jgi:filamentous hemagglutinin family protein
MKHFCAFNSYLIVAVTTFFAPIHLNADVFTDGTVGPRTHLSGQMRIGHELGTTKGANLFHSFKTFNIHNGESATFTGPAEIQNVISRVTGGELSTLDGPLNSEVGNADVYLINPSGVMFGKNASINVPAAFHVSTADELRFSDGSRYSARDPNASTLTFAPPEAFGFLTPNANGIRFEGGQIIAKKGKTVTMSAGDIAMIGDTEYSPKIQAPGGRIKLDAIGNQTTELALAAPSTYPGLGHLQLDYAEIDTSGDGGGQIDLNAGTATLKDSKIMAHNNGATDALEGIKLRIEGLLQMNLSQVWADTQASGTGANIEINANELKMNGATIRTVTYRPENNREQKSIGRAGNLQINIAGLLDLFNGSGINSASWGEGRTGQIDVQAGSLRLDVGDEYSPIVSDNPLMHIFPHEALLPNAPKITPSRATGIGTLSASNQDSAPVNILVENVVEILNGGQIGSISVGESRSADVSIHANTFFIDGQFAPLSRVTVFGSVNFLGSGNNGNLNLKVDDLLQITHDGVISSTTFSTGQAGNINIEAGRIKIDGAGSKYYGLEDPNNLLGIVTGIGGGTGIEGGLISNSMGNGGTINLTVHGQLDILNNGQVANTTNSAGDAGQIYIKARELNIDNARIESAASAIATGQTGKVDIDSYRVIIDNSGQINISANQANFDKETSNSYVHINSKIMSLDNNSRVTTESRFTNASPIIIDSERLLLSNSFMTTSAGTLGQGGNIYINTKQSIFNGGFIQANTKAQGAHGGDIQFGAETLIVSHGQLDVGNPLRIEFKSGNGRNVIQAASPGGEQGQIQITTTLDISSLLAMPPVPMGDPNEISNVCDQIKTANPSSLIDRSLGGVPDNETDPISVWFGGSRLNKILEEWR